MVVVVAVVVGVPFVILVNEEPNDVSAVVVAVAVVVAAAVVVVVMVVGVLITIANVRPLFEGRCVMSHAENS